MAIIDSVRKLAEKVGADTNGRTIADQLNIINQKLDNTQPGSRDIADAVEKFADKEDGTAILVTKTITENKTYKAEDDGASGYSSVTVNVPDEAHFNIFTVTSSGYPGSSFKTVFISSPNGIYDFADYPSNMGFAFVLVDPVKKVINATGGWGSHPYFTFTPSEDYDGFYSDGGNKYTLTGDEVTAGDGKTYTADFYFGPGTYTMSKSSSDFIYSIS